MTTAPLTGPHEIQRMLPRHFKIMEMKLAGYTNVDISKTVGLGENAVSYITRSPLFVTEYNRQLKEQTDNGIAEDRAAFAGKARSILDSATTKAANRLVDLIDSDDESVGLRASGSILDRALGKVDNESKGGPSLIVQINSVDALLISNTFKESQNGT